MAKMGNYCKAYLIKDLRAFPGWSENLDNARENVSVVDGQEQRTRRPLTEDDFFYLQENHVVTDGIFMDEYVIFDDVTPEWVEYCRDTLQFEVPSYAVPDEDEAATAELADAAA